MPVTLAVLALIFAAIAITFLIAFGVTYRRYSGTRLINCPENHEPAAVHVNALRAASAAVREGGADLRLSSCSRWPEMAGCDEACLRQIADSPSDCLVRNIVAQWYAGQRCAICDRAIPPVVWHEQPPAVLGSDGITHEWTEERPEELPKIFASHAPICWTCHLTESFRRENPAMVIERPQPTPPMEVLRPTATVY